MGRICLNISVRFVGFVIPLLVLSFAQDSYASANDVYTVQHREDYGAALQFASAAAFWFA